MVKESPTLRVIDGGVGKGGDPAGPDEDDGEECPVRAIGRSKGVFHFLDVAGDHRELTARDLGARHSLVGLFGGDDKWLRKVFPKKVPYKSTDEHGAEVTLFRTADFRVNDAAAAMQRACFAAGRFGNHIVLRAPGIWRGDDGFPVVHCGDKVMIGINWFNAGERTGNQIWAEGDPTLRPGIPCSVDAAVRLQADLQMLWRWRETGAPIAILGLIANSYFGAATRWRPGAFVTGETGSGKSALLDVIRAALPMHFYDNDTTKAGIEQAVHGRAMPIIIDEAADRANPRAGRELADLMLSAAGGEGTKGSRGTSDGKGRKIELAGLIMMFSINPPDLEPQHLGRLTLIDLLKPDDGADYNKEHIELATWMREMGPSLWGRALGAWGRYRSALELFRDGLRNHGCAPREMDQLGALLAGWWILTHEGLPDERGVKTGLCALHGAALDEPGLIRCAEDVEADSRSKRMLFQLLASMVHLHRSSEREPVGKLIEIAFGESDILRSSSDAAELLTYYGIRVIPKCLRASEPIPIGGCECIRCRDKRGHIPRYSPEEGLWFSTKNPELKKLFAGTPFEGERWVHEMTRLPFARKHSKVRVGRTPPALAIWLPHSLITGTEGGSNL